MWIARDEDGKLFCYAVKPCKRPRFWMGDNDIIQLPDNWFPEVKWEDEEPRELILKPIELKED